MSKDVDKQVRLMLDEQTHQHLRLIAAQQGEPMAHVVRREIKRFVSTRPISRPEEPGRERRGK
jgi:hypothetical protein